VYPNYDDDAYVAVNLDAKSLGFAKRNLSRISDPLLRTQVWDDLWEMVRNTEMPLKDYVQMINMHFPKETNPITLEQLVQTISGRYSDEATIIYYWPPTTDGLRSDRASFIAGMEREYLRRFKEAKPGSDDQKLWFDNFVSVAQTPGALDQLSRWSTMASVAPGFPLDVDRQWNVAKRLSRFQHPKAASLLAALKKKDPSDRGVRQALSFEAVQPDLKIKEKWVGILKQPKPDVSLAEARAVVGSLFPAEQKPLAKRFANDFYDYLKANGSSENSVFVEGVAEGLAPLSCSQEESTRMKEFLKTTDRYNPSVVKSLKMGLEEDERCQRIRAMSSL
jgi:aminopeptidase N